MSANMPRALERLAMPELASRVGTSLRAAERELERAEAPSPIRDLTYADTHRYPPPPWAIETFVAAASGGGMTYTPYRGDQGVREAVASHIRKFLGIPTDAGRTLILTPGTQGALFVALGSVLDAGDTVLLVDPEYLSSERMLRYFDVNVVHIPIVTSGAGRPTLDFDAFESALVHRPRLLVFSHPNNPTGAMYGEETIRRIAELAQAADFNVLVDELYCRLVYDGEPFHHLAAIDGMAERTITLLGPSKSESLSGFRVGLAVAAPELVDRMEDIQSCTALRAPAYAQHLLTRWLRDDHDYMAARVAEYQAQRDHTVRRLHDSGLIEVDRPYGTAYMFPKVLVEATDQEVALALKREVGIIINPGYEFGPRGLGHMRICFAQDESGWDRTLDDIIGVLGRLDGR